MKISLLFVEHHLRSFWFRTGGEERISAALLSPPLPGKLLPIKTSKARAAAAASASSMALKAEGTLCLRQQSSSSSSAPSLTDHL